MAILLQPSPILKTAKNIYSQGVDLDWTPSLTFAVLGDFSFTLGFAQGKSRKEGDTVDIQFTLETTSFTHSTAFGEIRITNLPYIDGGFRPTPGTLNWQGITVANYTQLTLRMNPASNVAVIQASGSGQSIIEITAAHMPSGGTVLLEGSLTYRTTR